MVAFDAVGPSAAGTGNTGSLTLSWTHTSVAASTDIVVHCEADPGSPDTGVTLTCKCDGVAMTSLGRQECNAQTAGFLQGWRISGIAAGAHTILVTASGPPTDLAGGSTSVSGGGSFGTPVTSSGTSITASASVPSTTGLIVGGVASGDTIVSSANTSRFIINERGGAGNAAGNAAGSTAPATGSNVTVSWTLTASGDPWAVLAVEVQAAGAALGWTLPARPVRRPYGRARYRRGQWSQPGAPVAATPVTLSDAAAAVDDDTTTGITAVVPLADAAGAIDDLTSTGIQVTLGLADEAAAVDAITVSAAVPVADVAAAAESQLISVTEGDAAGAVESLAVTAAVPLAEAGGAVDALAPPSASVPLAEAAGAVDTAAAVASVPVSDAGAAVDAPVITVALAVADEGAAVESMLSGQPTFVADVAAAADALAVTAAVPLPDAGAAVESLAPPSASVPLPDAGAAVESSTAAVILSVADEGAAADAAAEAVQLAVADTGAAADQSLAAAAASLADAAGAADSIISGSPTSEPDTAGAADSITAVTVTAPAADEGAAADSLAVTSAPAVADAAGAADSLLVGEAVPAADSAGAADALAATVSAAIADPAAASDSLAVQKPFTGPVAIWDIDQAPPRWHALPCLPRWNARLAQPRWQLAPALPRWSLHPTESRWRILMAVFEPIAALSPESINVNWTSDLDGTTVDPTTAGPGSTALVVECAFPVSSGDQQHPSQPVTWYPAAWLPGGTGKGFIAQCPVGPGSTGPTFTAGLSYDVWSKVLAAGSESPEKFAGVQAVY